MSGRWAWLCAGACGVVLAGGPAHAQLYLRADAGGATADDFGATAAFGGGVGLNLPLGLRTDATFTYRPNLETDAVIGELVGTLEPLPEAFPTTLQLTESQYAINAATVESLSGFASLYYDLPDPFPFIEPFVGAGIGGTRFDPDDVTFSGVTVPTGFVVDQDATTSFSYHFTGGLAIDFFDRVAFDFAYRYVDLGEVEFTGQVTDGDIAGIGATPVQLNQFSDDVVVHEGLASIRITL